MYLTFFLWRGVIIYKSFMIFCLNFVVAVSAAFFVFNFSTFKYYGVCVTFFLRRCVIYPLSDSQVRGHNVRMNLVWAAVASFKELKDVQINHLAIRSNSVLNFWQQNTVADLGQYCVLGPGKLNLLSYRPSGLSLEPCHTL